MKKISLIIAITIATSPLTAVKIEYDDHNNIIPTADVCKLAEERLISIAIDLDLATSNSQRNELYAEFKKISNIVKRCAEKGFIDY